MYSVYMDLSGYRKMTLCQIYRKALHVPCLRVNVNGNAAVSPAGTDVAVLALERHPTPAVVDGLAGE
jgi:hypothetical protein